MLHTVDFQPAARPAVVSKSGKAESEYLRLQPNGAFVWVADPAMATPFGSMREAARMALRLPSGERAFGMPLEVELETYDHAHSRLH
jgi:hypothetical protein